MEQVVTHRATNGATVDLCAKHKEHTRKHIGVDYQGVSHGLHRGTCEECLGERIRAERAKIKYGPCADKDVPDHVRFNCARADQGQIVEIEYGGFGRAEHGHGDPFRRSRDTSIAGSRTPWTYERLVSS